MCPSKSGRFTCQCGVTRDKGLSKMAGGYSKWIYMQASATAFRDSRKQPLFIQPYMPRMHLDLHVDILGKQSVCMRVTSSSKKSLLN